MKNPVTLAVVSIVLYAIANFLLESRLSKYNVWTLVGGYSLIVCIASIIMRQITKTEDSSFALPTGLDLAWLLLLGGLLVLADSCYVGAYTNGGKLLAVTSIVVMMPVFASVVKLVITKEWPNLWQAGGYVLAAGAVLLVAKGSPVLR